MTSEEIGGAPSGGATSTTPFDPVDVPQVQWATHPILSKARLNERGDALEWPTATFEQLAELREFVLLRDPTGLIARHGARFNFDRFVDATFDELQPVPRIGVVDDIQRYYTRVTDNGFHVVGVFSAVTINGRRRYYQWLTGTWVDVGQSGFLYVRDDLDTHFSEVGETQLEEYQPGATSASVLPGTNDWSMEKFEAQYQPEPDASSAGFASSEEGERRVEEAGVLTPSFPASESGLLVQQALAAAIASIAHRGQVDRAGAAYIDHPARVAERFDWRGESVHHCAAWLHDVVEESDITEKDLLDAGISPAVVDVVAVLTRRSDVSDGDYFARINAHPIAKAVKLAALDDNSAAWRVRRLTPELQTVFAQTHTSARAALGG